MTEKKSDGGQAFPFVSGSHNTGMSLRDYFAGQALASMNIAKYGECDVYAKDAYNLADAMLSAREGKCSHVD